MFLYFNSTKNKLFLHHAQHTQDQFITVKHFELAVTFTIFPAHCFFPPQGEGEGVGYWGQVREEGVESSRESWMLWEPTGVIWKRS